MMLIPPSQKRRYRVRALVKVFLLLTVLAAVVVSAFVLDIRSMQVYARTHDFHVVIDAGHGGKDLGASGRAGVTERDINLQIAKNLAAEFAVRNIGVTLTREDRNWLASSFAGNKKKDDMNRRREIIEKVAPDLVISIHLNTYPDPSVRGLQIFYDRRGETSKKYADAVQHEINRNVPHVNRLPKTGDYYILECTQYPSILVECGFLSNPAEEKLLKSEEYQKILAYHIAAAVTYTKVEDNK